MNFLQSTIHSTLDALRDRYAPVSHTSNFRSTGQITPEEFVAAGDFLVYKFPSWSWSDASSPSRRVAYLPDGKQFLITRGVPCHRRLDDNFAGDAGAEDAVIKDGFGGGDSAAAGEDGEDEGWLRTGGGTVEHAKVGDVRTLDGSGNVGENEIMDDEDEIPDMEDEEDEDAIIRDPIDGNNKSPLRTYTLYITYTPYYRTPRLYLSGYLSPSEPLPPKDMMQDIVGDYKDKTVTLEDFPFADPSLSLKTASVHPCKHASVMKVLLDRADAALKLRRDRIAAGSSRPTDVTAGMEGLVDDTRNMAISGGSPSQDPGFKAGVAAAGGAGGDEWEVLGNESATAAVVADESAIRVDQYLVVFLKFMAGLMPGIQYDFTTGV